MACTVTTGNTLAEVVGYPLRGDRALVAAGVAVESDNVLVAELLPAPTQARLRIGAARKTNYVLHGNHTFLLGEKKIV